jgi:predicted acyl esterase
VERPPSLVAQYLSDGGWSYFHRTLRSGGAFEQGVLLPYSIRMARESVLPAREAFERELDGLRPWLQRLPLRRGESFLRHAPVEERWFFDMLENETYTDYWKQPTLSMAEHVSRYPDVPVVCQTSWYGHHVWATVEKWRALRGRGKAPKQLLIGPWLHGYDDYARTFAGEVDFGADAAFDIHAERLRFFDSGVQGRRAAGPACRARLRDGRRQAASATATAGSSMAADGGRPRTGRCRGRHSWPSSSTPAARCAESPRPRGLRRAAIATTRKIRCPRSAATCRTHLRSRTSSRAARTTSAGAPTCGRAGTPGRCASGPT